MNIMSRDFTVREKILLGILALIVVGFCYYYFIDRPVREGIETAKNTQANAETDLTILNAKIGELQRMQDEIDEIEQQAADGTLSRIESYNNRKAEIAFLNDVFENAIDYTMTFTNLDRDGDTIRRTVEIQYTADDYETAKLIASEISNCSYRNLISDLSYQVVSDRYYDYYYYRYDEDEEDIEVDTHTQVNMTVTFFETMVGGTEDSALPVEKTEPAVDEDSDY